MRRASWNAIGIMIARAPTFLTKAESSVTTPTSTTICRCNRDQTWCQRRDQPLGDAGLGHSGTDQKGCPDDDDDIVAKASESLVGGNDTDSDRGKQRQHRDQVVPQPPPYEEGHHSNDDGEGEGLIECHAAVSFGTGQLTDAAH